MSIKFRQRVITLFCVLFLLCLILDGQTALNGALDGVKICVYTIIPTLFPYIFLSSLLCSSALGKRIPLLAKIARACGIPSGAESIFFLGCIGGYPVGAKLIADSYHQGQISRQSAQRMLGFCSNAGPSFIFGILSAQFSKPAAPWLLWCVHILSAVLVGLILPNKEREQSRIPISTNINLPTILQHSLRAVGTICGWVILFRVLLNIFECWFLLYLSTVLRVIITGIIELVNGCMVLQEISNEPVKWIVSSCMLAWGGLCVTMQTTSVTMDLGIGMYIYGKLLQVIISAALAIPVCYLLYPTKLPYWLLTLPIVTAIIFSLVITSRQRHKKVVAFS